MPIADLEFFFLNLRARSVGEEVDLQYKCNNTVKTDSGEEKTCGHLVKVKTNVLDIVPKVDPNHTTKIELSPTMGMIMKYPTFKVVESVEKLKGSEVDRIMEIILSCIESIYTAEEVFYSKDIDKKELLSFVENLTRDQFAKLQGFFDSVPKIEKEIDFKCDKCGYEEKIRVEGIQNFFV